MNRLLAALGVRIVRTPPLLARLRRWRLRQRIAHLMSGIAAAPDDPTCHLAYAECLLQAGIHFRAHAVARSAHALAGSASTEAADVVERTGARLPLLASVDHNRYHRAQALARILGELGCGATTSILDVGGGEGLLAAAFPGAAYFLADTGTNGVSVEQVPAGLGAFDVVVACHVLEHIPVDSREAFLDGLLGRASSALVLLNPFRIEGDDESSRLRLIIDLTGAGWAREHLECGLPDLEEVRAYAASRGLEIRIEPVGALTTTIAFVFLEHYAALAGRLPELGRINALFNERLSDFEQAPLAPTGYAVVLRRPADSPAPSA